MKYNATAGIIDDEMEIMMELVFLSTQSLYDRMPVDYPDAFTINMAKVLQEGRLVRFSQFVMTNNCCLIEIFKSLLFKSIW